MNLKKIIRSFTDERWNVGFIDNDLDSIINGDPIHINWVKHNYKKSWFADPFILDVTDDEIILLVEEWVRPVERGRISKLTIDRHSFTLKKLDVVLELDTHLSFPAIERREDGVYIHPENSEAGNLTLYKYDALLNKCERVGVICDDAVTDAVSTDLFGGKLLFATKQPNSNGNVLCIYKWDENSKKFIEDGITTFGENVARMAGGFFQHNGKIYRPTQVCDGQYGQAVTLQEVNKDNGKLSFKEVRRIFPQNPKLPIGTHTFNVYKGVTVTDALGFDRMWIRKILKVFKVIP
jgi:hypothetical protein